MNIINPILRITVGLVFILSGVAKLYPIEPFELVFVDLGLTNFYFAPFIARFIIAFELFLGICIVCNVWLKNWIYCLTQSTLVLFTIYLIFLLITQGNAVDCDCLGSLLALTPIESIIKNVALMFVLLIIKRSYYASSWLRWLISLLFLIVSFIVTFLLNPVGLHNLQGIEVNEKVDYSALPELYQSTQKINFSKGKQMVVFVTWSCPHCINAARKFVVLHKKEKFTNLFFVVGSKKEAGLFDFIKKTKIDFPTIWVSGDEFFKYSGGRLPAIVYIEKGVIKKKWFGDLFDAKEISTTLLVEED